MEPIQTLGLSDEPPVSADSSDPPVVKLWPYSDPPAEESESDDADKAALIGILAAIL